MMLTALTLTPLLLASLSRASALDGRPVGSTGTVKSTCTAAFCFCRAARALSRRALDAVSSSTPPSMSKSSRGTPYVLNTLAYSWVREDTEVHFWAGSPPLAPPKEMMTLPPEDLKELICEVKAP